MTSEKLIADFPPSDGRDWDCQCARCGSSAGHDNCDNCAGEGYIEDEDFLSEGDYKMYKCDWCGGRGGWYICVSSAEWCESHPLLGRESVKRGQIEWFMFDAPKVKA